MSEVIEVVAAFNCAERVEMADRIPLSTAGSDGGFAEEGLQFANICSTVCSL